MPDFSGHTEMNSAPNCAHKPLEHVTIEYIAPVAHFKQNGKKKPLGKPRPVRQMTMGGKSIGVFKSIREAALVSGVDPKSINRCCRGDQKQAAGSRWMWA